MPEPTKYTCAKCSGVFTKGWSDAEAEASFRADMPEVPPDEPTTLICDDCYQQFMAWLKAHPEERLTV